ncbi:MAG: GNAT family N-acetyltransferase [Holdemanella sp.]|nr:GNAT family N-acetyltransferase [Holdemanella sp.]
MLSFKWVEICEKSLGYSTNVEIIEKRITELKQNPHYYIIVAEEDEEVVGFMEAEKYDLIYGERGYNLIVLGVLPAYQDKGYGKMLIEALEKEVIDNKASFIRLNSRVERKGAHGFYEHLGYEWKKTQKNFKKKVG